MTTTTMERASVGDLLREWRQRRHLSQLELSTGADVSARHLSFVETGRSRPSREMVLHLAEHLDVPLRARNQLLVAAGYAPQYSEADLDAPEMAAVRRALMLVLDAHDPYPAVVVDRRWHLVLANAAVGVLLEGVDQALLEPPVNVLRVSLHPDGLAPRILNLDEYRDHILGRLRRQVAVTGDDRLAALHDELAAYPGGAEGDGAWDDGTAGVVLPMRLRHGDVDLSFFSTITTFGTPVDVTLAELAVEAFYPADEVTAAALGGR